MLSARLMIYGDLSLLSKCSRRIPGSKWSLTSQRASPKSFTWRNSWRSTLLNIPLHVETNIDCSGVYSDVLYRPFFCAHTSLRKFSTRIPRENQISRLKNLSQHDFSSNWSDKPFILTEPVKEWPVFKNWTTQSLLKDYPEVLCRAEAVDWPLEVYVDYMQRNKDESPLYLFDRAFVEKMNLKTGKDEPGAAYWAPECFGQDLFAVLGDQRPDSRWMIMGPDRSGSTFHKDPNATSAWNAVLTGSKYWLMFPSGKNVTPPPGVILSEDSSEITSPLSIAEYLLCFHEYARETPGCKEGICYAGEVLHVPSGWFHLVLNLDEGIAITQNFVPENKLVDVLQFLRDTPDQVSGFRDDVTDPYDLFVQRLRKSHPKLLETALGKLDLRTKSKTSKWERLTKPDSSQSLEELGGFAFDFDEEEDNDE